MNLTKFIKQKQLLLIFILLMLALMQSCGNSDKNTEPETVHKEDDHNENEVALTDEQIKLLQLEFSKAGFNNLRDYINANGEIAVYSDNESKVGGIISGRVSEIFVNEGSYVHAGQTLAYIENPDLINAQVEYIEAKHEYEHALTEYERQSKLASYDIGSKKELAKLKAEFEHAVIELKSAEQKLLSYKISKSNLENYEDIDNREELQKYYPVVSPISGSIIARNVSIGQFVEPSMDMFHVINTSVVFADLNIFEKDLSRVGEGQKVIIESSAYPGELFEGIISVINSVLNDKSRTLKARTVIKNRMNKLLPNMFIKGKIYFSDNNTLSVPKSAVESEGGRKFVFIKTDDKHDHESHESHNHNNDDTGHANSENVTVFKKVYVLTGTEDDKYIEISSESGINPGDEVVTGGTYYLKSELSKAGLEAHEH